MITRAMARSQAIQATNHEDTMNTRDSDSIWYLESSDDDIFDDEVAAEDEDVPDDDAASWTTYYSGGDDESPPPVLHDVKLPSVSAFCDVPSVGVVLMFGLSAIPALPARFLMFGDVSSSYDDSSSAAINFINAAHDDANECSSRAEPLPKGGSPTQGADVALS